MTGNRFYKLLYQTAAILLVVFLFSTPAVPAESGAASKQTQSADVNAKLEDITVTAERAANPVTPVTTPYAAQHNVVTEEQIRQENVYDFPSALRNVPGVLFQSKNLMGGQTSHSVYIRGRGANHPSADFTVEFDGVPRFGALFGQVLGDSIALPTIGGIEIYKSPQPSQFGNGYASINVLPKYMKEDGRQIGLDASGGSYATFSQSLYGGVKEGPFDFYLSQSWASTDGHVDHSRAQQQSYYANTGYQMNQAWYVRLLVNYVKSQTLAPMPDETPTSANGVSWPGAERYDTQTILATLSLNHQYDRFGGYLKAYRNDTDFDILQELTSGKRSAGGTDGLHSRQSMSLYGIRAKETIHAWKGGELLVGADLDLAELKNTQWTYSGAAVTGYNGGLAERVWNFPDTTLFSPYLAVNQTFGRAEGFHMTPSAGVRYFAHDPFENKAGSQAGLVLGYGHTDINFNYARGVNYPSPIVLMAMVVSNSTIGNPSQYWEKINPEAVDHYEVGLTHTWPKKASVGVTAFNDKGKDRYLAFMSGTSVPIVFNDPIGTYKIQGLEITGTLNPVKSLELFAAATWLDVKATGSNGVERDFMPYTPEFQFQAGVNWTFLQNFRLTLDMQHIKDVYAGTNMRGSFNYSALAESSKLSDTTLVNGRLGYRFDYKPLKLKDSEVFIAVNNLFDEDYEWARGYSMPGTTVFAGFSIKL